MIETDPPLDDPISDGDGIVVAVIRTGGVAGIRRRWQVMPPGDEAQHWVMLIEKCPWDAEGEQDSGADRYVWSIRARTPETHRQRDVADSELTGPWRDLVEAVRSAS